MKCKRIDEVSKRRYPARYLPSGNSWFDKHNTQYYQFTPKGELLLFYANTKDTGLEKYL